MSTKYEKSSDVPLNVLISRLDKLSDAVIHDRERAEFTMRIPAECDRDADLVISEAAIRLEHFEQQNKQLLAKLGTIGALMKEQRYDEALALLPPNCEQVVRELQIDSVDKYNKAFTGICKEMGVPQIANAAEAFAKAYIIELRNPEQ